MSEKSKDNNEQNLLRGIGATLGTMALLAAGVLGATKLQEARNHYGYDPARNPSPPANINNGINPANILRHQPDK